MVAKESGSCIFCSIIAGEAPGFILDEDDSLIVFLSLESHPLIVPKKHVQDIFALDSDTAARIAQKSIRIAKALA
jgi:histidine triad (HIT) family protein